MTQDSQLPVREKSAQEAESVVEHRPLTQSAIRPVVVVTFVIVLAILAISSTARDSSLALLGKAFGPPDSKTVTTTAPAPTAVAQKSSSVQTPNSTVQTSSSAPTRSLSSASASASSPGSPGTTTQTSAKAAGSASALKLPAAGLASVPHVPVKRSFYVDCAGNDSSSGLSSQQAWQSVGAVTNRTFQPGDGIYLKRGCTFEGRLEIRGSGSALAPVVVDSYGQGERAVLTNWQAETWESVVDVHGSNVVVQNLDLQGAPSAGVYLQPGTSNVIVRNNIISQTGFGVFINGNRHLITHNQVSNLRMVRNTPGGTDDYGAIGFPINGNDITVSYNSCRLCRAESHDWRMDGGFTEVWNHGQRLQIDHNIADRTNGFIEFGAEEPGRADQITISQNLIINAGSLVTVNKGNAFSIDVSGVDLMNNTVVQTEPSKSMMVFPDVRANSLDLRRNIFYLKGDVSLWWDYAPFPRSDNLYYTSSGARIGFKPGRGDAVGDPKFVNTAAGDYRPRAISPAVQLAKPAPDNMTGDLLGRPIGATIDIGALQH